MVANRAEEPRGFLSQWAAFIAPFCPLSSTPQGRGWRPLALRPPYLLSLVCLVVLLALTMEGLRQYSLRQGGLVFFNDTSDVSSLQSFAYNCLPIVVALILVMVWTVTDFDVLRLEPYFQLSLPQGAPATVLFINYNFGQTVLTPINAARRRHWVVLWTSILSLSIRLILPALQSTLFELREVTTRRQVTMKSWPDLVDLETQASWMMTQANKTVDSMLSSDEQIRRSRSMEYAIAPVEIPGNDHEKESTLWVLDQELYWAEVDCQTIPLANKLSFAINQPDNGWASVSWNATDVDLEDVHGHATPCKMDFTYNSVFFPATDYMQIRYWEPAINPAILSALDNEPNAFTISGCDPYDLYGMIIAINATNAADATSMNASYVAFGVGIACDITYRKAQARVSMHSNSSIESIHIQSATTTQVTAAEFNIENFQSLLSQRAPYTSDMIFIRENETTGGRTVTQLPIISQDIGEIQPLLVLDTTTLMTPAAFESKITRDVEQTFVLTLGRLFDPGNRPAVVAGFKLTTQVAIAVVQFAAIWSELILATAAFTAVYFLFFYRSRQTFLQSDPGSIGAMCSIASDIFHDNNILAQPHIDFHQFSTRQMRRIFRKARCYWRSDSSGNRLEILAEDGSPVQLGEDLRVHADPMPHFLVIPLFIVEFLLLAAVIILMSLVVSSLARNGRFKHLTQTGSSSLQVVLSFLPSIVASSVGSLCTSIYRNLCVLEPWVHLQRGQALAKASISLNYASQSPFVVFFKSLRGRHVLLGLISLACVVNMVLTVVAGALFTQEMTTSTLPTEDVRANYSHSVFWRTDFAAEFTEYDLIQTSITSGVPMLSWTSPNQSFIPLDIQRRNPDVTYSATTLGVGSHLKCSPLSPTGSLEHNTTSGRSYWRYAMFENASQECVAAMPTVQNANEGIDLSIQFLSASDFNHSDICQTSTVVVVGRWNYMANTPVATNNTIALHCEPHVLLQNYTVTFDHKGQIGHHYPLPQTSITEGKMYENATVSLGQFNKVFVAIPEDFVGNTTATRSKTFNISSYDWAGFLVARLYRRADPEFDSLDQEMFTDLTQAVYQWVYATYFSIWHEIYLQPLKEPQLAANATVTQRTWGMVPSVPALAAAFIIIIFDTLVVLIVFSTRHGRFRAPRMPRSIGAVIPWIAQSRMLGDFQNTHTWTNHQRREHLSKMGKRYSFRQFVGADGRSRYAVDEEPANAIKHSTSPAPSPPGVGDDYHGSEQWKSTAVQLRELPAQGPRPRA
ncbi:Uncharacterized protein PECH_008970 [Penicillium ucsense]|uniref:Uncharacterized protein n=1 Tax=Penicillium ucsense TaxID=2839758 RepID=A0A8J8WJ58_9EURO|nr:Uncharacterized protein PECM_001428 [Penicillium ucsense]KAF7733756.1 Uncharacterized protein PECH_008970 [Penicillium ucsense]